MKLQRIATISAASLLLASPAFAVGGGFAGAGAFTIVEGYLTGDIAEFAGICAIVALGILLWLAHEYGHMFMYVFRAIVGIAFIVFALQVYTAVFGAGATMRPEHLGLVRADALKLLFIPGLVLFYLGVYCCYIYCCYRLEWYRIEQRVKQRYSGGSLPIKLKALRELQRLYRLRRARIQITQTDAICG